jgi:outer membrane protein OmpA-like peptidoglycan-associated protein
VEPTPKAFVTVIFTSGSFRLDRNGKDKLDEVGVQMIGQPGLRAQSTGYSKPGERIRDGTRLGSSMGEARASSVKSYLVVVKGIDPAGIATSGGR